MCTIKTDTAAESGQSIWHVFSIDWDRIDYSSTVLESDNCCSLNADGDGSELQDANQTTPFVFLPQ